MASQSSPIATYKDTGATSTLKRQVSDKFLLMSPKSFPELALFGGGTDDTPTLDTLDLSEGEMQSDRIEWFEDAARSIVWTLNADINNSVTTWVTNPAADAANVLVGMIIRMESEDMIVTANGNGSTGDVTVTRAYNGTSAAAHTAANVAADGGVRLITRAHLEGTDAPSDPYEPPTNFYNYFQIYMEEVKVSDAEKGMSRYTLDPGGFLDRRIAKAYIEIYKQMTLSFYRGVRTAMSATVRGQTGGIETFVNSSLINNLSAATLTTTHVNALLQEIFEGAGADQVADVIFCSAANKIKLTNLFAGSLVTVNRDASAGMIGGLTVDRILTEFGELGIVMSNWTPTDKIYFFKRDMIQIGPLRNNELREKVLATSGDYERTAVTGAYVWQFMGSKCHGILRNFT